MPWLSSFCRYIVFGSYVFRCSIHAEKEGHASIMFEGPVTSSALLDMWDRVSHTHFAYISLLSTDRKSVV